MVKVLTVEGYDAFKTAAETKASKIYALFSGSVVENGQSWCPDCVVADPVITEKMQVLGDDVLFIHCNVGDRAFWKDQSNVFRTDPKLKVRCLPTLTCLGQPQRLEEAECKDASLVQMFFEE